MYISEIDGFEFAAHLLCPKCKRPSSALLNRTPGANFTPVENLEVDDGDITDRTGWKVFGFWPAEPAPVIPGHLPPAAERAYVQAERNFPENGNEEAAGTMYRKALDVGLRTFAPDVTGNLKKRIDTLVEQHKITPSLGAWAHQIRQLGNDSAHDEDPPTRDELTSLRNFTSLVMQYLFTLPKNVDLAKPPTANAKS